MQKEPHYIFPGTQRLRHPRYPCPAERGTRLTRPDEEHTWEACYVYTIYSTNSADFGHWAWKIQTWRTTSSRYIWSDFVFYLFIVVQWDAHSPEVSMNIRTAKVCVPWFAILSIEGHPNSCRTSFFVVGMIYSLLIAIIPSAEYFGQQLLFKRKYRRVVPIHGHLHWHLKREVSRSRKEFKIAIIFRRRSREDSLFQALHYLKAWRNTEATEKKGVDLWKQMSSKLSDRLHFLAEYFDLNPYPSATTVYARSAFYPNLRFTLSLQSAFYTQSAFYPWSAVCGPQSSFYTDRLKYINGYNWWSAGELWGSVYIQG